MSEIWGTSSLTNRRSKNHHFWRFHILRVTLTAYIFRMKHDRPICKRGRALQTTRSLLHCLKQHELLFTNGFKLEVSFHPPSVNSAFHFIATLGRQRSANGTQPNFAKRWTVNQIVLTMCRRNVGVVHPKKSEGQKTLHLFGFRRLRELMANICRTKRHIDNREGRWKVREVITFSQKIHELWSTKRLKTGPEFYPPSLSQSIAHPPSVRH